MNWLIAAAVVTAAYLGFIVWQLGATAILGFLSSPKLNEIGDFLAGVFSPLAFIWLVAAVLTQRQELTDTREQFAENQKVVDAQLETIKDQSALLQQQHTLAEEIAKKTYRLSLFEQRFAIYNETVAIHSKMENSGIIAKNHSDIKAISTKASFVFGDEVEEFFDHIEQLFVEYFVHRENYNNALETDKYDLRNRGEEQLAADNLESALRTEIISLLEPEALKDVMWADMRVSDS